MCSGVNTFLSTLSLSFWSLLSSFIWVFFLDTVAFHIDRSATEVEFMSDCLLGKRITPEQIGIIALPSGADSVETVQFGDPVPPRKVHTGS